MRAKELVQAIIGSKGFVLEDITGSTEIKLSVHPTKREKCRCGICHRRAPLYGKGRGMRRWRCLDVGAQRVYVEAESPRVCCRKPGVVTATVPWARHGSRLTKSFEKTAAWLSTHASRSTVSEFMRVEWHTVGGICERVYQELETSPACPVSTLWSTLALMRPATRKCMNLFFLLHGVPCRYSNSGWVLPSLVSSTHSTRCPSNFY